MNNLKDRMNIGIVLESSVIVGVLCLIALKDFFITKIYISQMMKISQGHIEISVIGITGLIYVLIHTFLLIIMGILLAHLIRSYFKNLNKENVKKINRIVIIIITILIGITSVADVSDVLGIHRTGIELELTHKIIFYFLIRIPVAIMNTSTLLILSVMTLYSVKIYRKTCRTGEVFSVIYSIILGAVGYMLLILLLNILEIQQLIKSKGKIVDLSVSVEVFKMYFGETYKNMKEIINPQNVLGIVIIIFTGIFMIIRIKRERLGRIVF